MARQAIENGNGNQQLQVNGDNHAPTVLSGSGMAAAVGTFNGKIVVNQPAVDEGKFHTFDTKKKLRIPISSTTIGVVSGVVGIVSFLTGITSLWGLCDLLMSAVRAASASTLDYTSIVGPAVRRISIVVLVALIVVVCRKGWKLRSFLKNNIIWLPRHWRLWAWAGVKEENGRTFPYMLRLSMKCPECGGDMRFMTLPDSKAPMAVCPRNVEHSIRVDVAKNDFREPLKR